MSVVGEVTEFGHAMKKHFLFDPKWTNVNHGSFGTYPAPVRNALRGYQKLTEAAPDKFLRYQYVELLNNARERIASLLNAPVDDCVFVLNPTTAINTILRNLTWKPKDAIVYFDVVYGSIEKTLISLLETNPQIHLSRVGQGQDFGYTLPATHSEILNAFSQTISRLFYDGYRPRVVVFDTITSLPAVRFPFERIIKICKEYDILSVIDGAHGVGQIPLDLTALDPDFFTSSCNKWLYAPRGCAVMYVPKRNQHLIRTTYPTSHGYVPSAEFQIRTVLPPATQPAFINLFQFVGTADNSPFYCVPAALNFRANICGGEAAIYKYIRDVCQQGADLLASILGTKVMDDIDSHEDGETNGHAISRSKDASNPWAGGLRDCAMANVLLPIEIEGINENNSSQFANPVIIKREDIGKHVNWMHERMIFDFHTHVVIFEYNDKMWTRVSGQIYVELKDFEWLGGLLKELLERIRNGESLMEQDTLPARNGDVDLEAVGQGVQDVNIGAVFKRPTDVVEE